MSLGERFVSNFLQETQVSRVFLTGAETSDEIVTYTHYIIS